MEKRGIIEGRDRQKSFDITIKEPNCFTIAFDEYVYALSFFQHGSEIQELLESRVYRNQTDREKQYKTNCNSVIIDLSRTVWFDTLALCYLFMFLYDAKRIYGNNQVISFTLPSDEKFISFLFDNGFFYHIGALDPEKDFAGGFDCGDTVYSTVHKCFYPFEVFESRDVIQDKIDNVCLAMENAYSGIINPEQLEYLVNKLSYFLYETMDNVFDHAYPDSIGYCGVLIKLVNCNDNKDYKSYLDGYTSKTPYILINLHEDNDAFLEVYIVDTGCGLKKSFDSSSPATDLNIIDYIFEEGERSHRKIKHEATRFGGLHDIRELFEQDADGLGIKADSIWKYVYRYSDKKDPIRINTESRYGSFENLIHGFALVASIHVPKAQISNTEECTCINEEADRFLDDLLSQKIGAQLLLDTYIIDNRWDSEITRDWAPNTHKKTTVIFPPNIATKRWITKKICDQVRENTLFLEVPDAEVKKYRVNISGISCSKVATKRIIVVSKSLNVSFFVVGTEGYFICSNEKRDAYYRTPYSDISGLADSFSAVLIFDKLYNSTRFWDFAPSLSGNHIHVLEKVQWSEDFPISEYLDFSQMNRIPECRDICVQKLNQLRVLKNGAYFNSVDRFTDEICDRANFEIGGNRDGQRINIGSVYVSGTSNRLLSETDNCFYFLCHFDSKNPTINALLTWIKPKNRKQISIFINPKEEFQRLGKSSFIARSGSDYLMKRHYANSDSVYKLNTASLYNLLQRRIGVRPDTLKIGHFESTERHDLFGYRTNYFYDSDTIERQLKPSYDISSIYDFLTTNIIYSLIGKTIKRDFMDCFNTSITPGKLNSLWCKYRDSNDCHEKRGNGILVYFTDFQTSILIEKIQKYLSKDLIKRIIPVISLSKNYERGSLVISPLIIDRIEEQIGFLKEQQSEVIVTVFESVTFHVRRIEEIKQILYSIGANKVKVLSLLDRRRIPITESKPSISAFGRIDTPALYGKYRCSICNALDKLGKCKNQLLNFSIKARIEEILMCWQCLPISDNEYRRGLKPKRIRLTNEALSLFKCCEDYWGESLKIELDAALCSLVVEYTVVSTSAQLLIRLLEIENLVDKDNSEIDSIELKMLLASTYLLLFAANPVSTKQVRYIVEELAKNLDIKHETTPITSLAVLVICGLPEQYMKCLCEKYEEYEKTNDDSHGLSISIDSLIARIIAYLSLVIPEDTANGFVLLERKIRCYLIGSQSKQECLYDIFMYSETSYENSHRHAFAKIIDEAAVMPRDYQDALAYSTKVLDIIDKDPVYISLFHSKELFNKKQKLIISEIRDAVIELHKMVDWQKTSSEVNTELETSVRESIIIFINSLCEINTPWLYLQTSMSKDSENQKSIESWLEYCIERAKGRVKKCKAEVDFCFDIQSTNPNSNCWFYSFNDITEEVINLMVDMINYREGKIQWNKNGNAYYDGLINVSYSDRYVEISFVNKIDRETSFSIEEIRDIKMSKSNRDSLLVFKEFENSLNESGNHNISVLEFDFSKLPTGMPDQEDDIFKATMRIPYINRGQARKPNVFERERSIYE